MFDLGSHFVSRDFFIYHLNRTHVTSKMASSRSLQEQVWLSYGDLSNQV